MTQRRVKQRIVATAVSEGAGVTVRRTLGTPALRHLDPFLMLDHFSSDNPNDYIAGFPDHPHRGFNTFTYMIDGHMQHQDSMGNTGDLRAGGAQWMKAASGVIHSEMPQQSAGLMRGFQLWINLPAAEKMNAPAYQEFSPDAFPSMETDGARVKILLGHYSGKSGPISDPHTQVEYFDVTIPAQGQFHHTIGNNKVAMMYVYAGTANLGDTHLDTHTLAVLGDGDEIEIQGGEQGARFILVSGLALGEPIVQYGPFVMNTREEIEQAMADYRQGRLVQKKASMVGN